MVRRRECNQLRSGHADAAALTDRVKEAEVQAIPPARGRWIEPVGMPQDRERRAVDRGPVEQALHTRPGIAR